MDARRKSLDVETLESILRVRINGPNLKDFHCFKYLSTWEAAGHLLSDAQPPRGKGKKDKHEETDDPIETILDDAYVKEMWENRNLIFIPNVDQV